MELGIERASARRAGGAWLRVALAAAVLALAAAVLAVGCERSPEPADQAEPDAPAAPGAGAARALAAAPSYDLLANRARVRVHQAGLTVRFSDDSFRIYDLALRDVWGPAGELRRLTGKARLRLPWRGGAAVLTVRFAGKGQLVLAGKRHELRARKAAGGELAVISLGDKAAGELELLLEPNGKLAVASLELAAPDAAPCPQPAADTRPADALAGARLLEISLELPAAAALRVTPRGGQGAVAVRGEDGRRIELWRGRGDGQVKLIELGLAPQLATLELESPACDVAWQAPRLGVLASSSPEPRGTRGTPGAPAASSAPVASSAPRASLAARHVVLIVVDTLRADRLSAIADTRVRTPRLSAALDKGGLAFARNLAVAPSSPPSHATIHTGQLPRVHGAVGDTAGLAPGAPLLSALLAERGFFTGYVGNNDFAMGRLAKAARWREAHTPVFENQGIDCAPLVARALTMMERAVAAKERAFLTLLPIEPHVPYRFHEDLTERYFAGPYAPPLGKRVTSAHLSRARSRGLSDAGWQQLRALYDGEVTYFDGCFGALEDGLARLGVAKDTAIILTSDHGEGMGERGNNTGHAYSLNHELVWVPLLVFGGPFAATDAAGRAAPAALRRHVSATSNLDLAPTVLELLGVAPDPRMQGQSLLPLLRGQRQWPRAVVAEYGKAYSVSAGRWHYVADYEGRGKLYDVVADPAQLRDRSADALVPLRYLREAAAIFLSQRTRWRGTWGSWTDFSADNPLGGAGAR
ncbi:MAG: sulfatase [Myxococcales bacterium]|nr:sulfatase [Myxococcales bacterium]